MNKQQQIKAIKAYLIKEYGDNHFSKSDFKRMEFGDDGIVYIGFSQIVTNIKI